MVHADDSACLVIFVMVTVHNQLSWQRSQEIADASKGRGALYLIL